LKKLVSLKPTQNELKYKLEQLRFIENGFSIYVSNYDKEIPSGIDTPEDVKNANIYLLNNENS
jgi:CMP-2-keto-3-deoxyoctulosonic acid synthetase